jgi:chorismate synthase
MSTFSFLTTGESHGPQLTVVVTGMPAGVRGIDTQGIRSDAVINPADVLKYLGEDVLR